MQSFRAPALVLAVIAGCGWTIAADDAPPIARGLHESVVIRLVTIDVVALDRKDRTVADLTKADFKLVVDRHETPIDTVDVDCSGGVMDDPKATHFGDWETPADLPGGTRRIVLAFDYLHLASTQHCARALQAFQEVLSAKTQVRDEEIMVAALTGGLRVEQPFTKDREAVVASLHRMENDVSLWNGNFSHLTELPLFEALQALVTQLHSVRGPTAVVFLTAGRGPGRRYQLEFERFAAAASAAQVAMYPVDLRGLEGPTCVGCGTTGAPVGLWRLASVTGGRLTSDVNDPTIGYARARRDLGCRYTLGFYDRKPQEDRQHTLRVSCGRKGVHLLHADRYAIPSTTEHSAR